MEGPGEGGGLNKEVVQKGGGGCIVESMGG